LELVNIKEISIKICVFGDAAVGKTTIINKFCSGDFVEKYEETLGAGFSEYELKGEQIDPKYKPYKVNLNIYDIAAQSSFNHLLEIYTSGLHGYFLAFAVDNSRSLENLRKWKEKIVKLNPETDNIPFLVIGTKNDIPTTIPVENMNKIEQEFDKKIVLTSSKKDENVSDVFITLSKLILDEFDEL